MELCTAFERLEELGFGQRAAVECFEIATPTEDKLQRFQFSNFQLSAYIFPHCQSDHRHKSTVKQPDVALLAQHARRTANAILRLRYCCAYLGRAEHDGGSRDSVHWIAGFTTHPSLGKAQRRRTSGRRVLIVPGTAASRCCIIIAQRGLRCATAAALYIDKIRTSSTSATQGCHISRRITGPRSTATCLHTCATTSCRDLCCT